jgi:hypothetical protein
MRCTGQRDNDSRQGRFRLYEAIRCPTNSRPATAIGTKAEAEKLAQEIADLKVVAFNTALSRTDG